MGVQLQVILTAYFVNSGWALMVQLHSPIAEQTFNKIKEELWTAKYRKANKKISLYKRSKTGRDNGVVKREIKKQKTNESLASSSVDSSEERKRDEMKEELRIQAEALLREVEGIRQGVQNMREEADALSQQAEGVQYGVKRIQEYGDDRAYGRAEDLFAKAEEMRRKADEELKVAEKKNEQAEALYELIRNNS